MFRHCMFLLACLMALVAPKHHAITVCKITSQDEENSGAKMLDCPFTQKKMPCAVNGVPFPPGCHKFLDGAKSQRLSLYPGSSTWRWLCLPVSAEILHYCLPQQQSKHPFLPYCHSPSNRQQDCCASFISNKCPTQHSFDPGSILAVLAIAAVSVRQQRFRKDSLLLLL